MNCPLCKMPMTGGHVMECAVLWQTPPDGDTIPYWFGTLVDTFRSSEPAETVQPDHVVKG